MHIKDLDTVRNINQEINKIVEFINFLNGGFKGNEKTPLKLALSTGESYLSTVNPNITKTLKHDFIEILEKEKQRLQHQLLNLNVTL